MNTDGITAQVIGELERAMRKFPTWPTDPLHALAVLGEEFGELTKDVLQLTYEPHKTSAAEVREEAVQTAAMALRLLASLDRYSYLPGDQHAQQPITASVVAAPAPQQPKCQRCMGEGQIDQTGYGEYRPCPECNPASPYYEPPASGVPASHTNQPKEN